MDIELTKEEERFIRALKRAAKNIPERLWLFCSESGLHVMAKNDDGNRVWISNGVDQEYVVEDITDDVTSGSW